MSMALIAFLNEIPDRQTWQKQLDEISIPIRLATSIEVKDYSGFAPMKLSGFITGVEIYIDNVADNDISDLGLEIGDRTKMMTFRFASRASEACCANGASLALVKYENALVHCFEPMTYEQLKQEYEGFLPDALEEMKAENIEGYEGVTFE